MAKNSAAKKQVAPKKNSQTSAQSNVGVGVAQKLTKKQDAASDKKTGVKENSTKDKKLDKKYGFK